MDSEQAGKDQKTPLVEHVAQSGDNHAQESMETVIPQNTTGANTLPDKGTQAASSIIIWTPRFIILFGLTLVFGLSLESILTQGW